MNTYTRLAAAVVAVLAIGGAIYLIGPRNGVGTPTPVPTVAPSTTAVTPTTRPSLGPPTSAPTVDINDLTKWTTFVSGRYGYTAKYPPQWGVAVATEQWALQTREQFWSSNGNGADRFISPGGASALHLPVFASELLPGTTSDQWIDAYEVDCGAKAADMTPIVVDGHPGLRSSTCDDLAVFVQVGTRMFVFSLDAGPEGEALFEKFLSTVRLPAS